MNYKNLLDKNDPLDRNILDLAENGKLKINVVELKEPYEYIHHEKNKYQGFSNWIKHNLKNWYTIIQLFITKS